MAKIWFLGEALIDFVPTTSPVGPAFAPRAGGSPFNAAKAAAQAGAKVGFLGGLSNDLFGELLIEDLKAHGVDTTSAPVSALPTTLAFVDLSTGSPRYAFFNEGTATQLMNPDPQAFHPCSDDVVSFGSISLIDAPGAGHIAAFAAAMKGKALMALDPNARPGMTHDLAGWRARIDMMARLCGVVKLSDEDLDVLAPGSSPQDYAQGLLDCGAGLVILTRGQDGATGYCAHGQVLVPGVRVQVADTVGAGDTLMGSMLAELALRGLTAPGALAGMGSDTLQAILEYAVAAAALNCRAVGCAPPRRTDVLAFLAGR